MGVCDVFGTGCAADVHAGRHMSMTDNWTICKPAEGAFERMAAQRKEVRLNAGIQPFVVICRRTCPDYPRGLPRT